MDLCNARISRIVVVAVDYAERNAESVQDNMMMKNSHDSARNSDRQKEAKN